MNEYTNQFADEFIIISNKYKHIMINSINNISLEKKYNNINEFIINFNCDLDSIKNIQHYIMGTEGWVEIKNNDGLPPVKGTFTELLILEKFNRMIIQAELTFIGGFEYIKDLKNHSEKIKITNEHKIEVKQKRKTNRKLTFI